MPKGYFMPDELPVRKLGGLRQPHNSTYNNSTNYNKSFLKKPVKARRNLLVR